MASIGESTKIFLQDLIEYSCSGNAVLVKTENLLFSTVITAPYMTWIVIYKGQRFTVTEELGSFDTVNESIFRHILETDRKTDGTVNS